MSQGMHRLRPTAELKAKAIKTTNANKARANQTGARLARVAETLEGYARRGVFRGFSQEPDGDGGKAIFKLLWHRNRVFELVFEAEKNTLRFPLVLPNLAANSAMYRELKAFIKARQAVERPEHRRIDPRKAQVQAGNRGGQASLTLRIKDGDDEYATRKLIHLVQEIYLTFLLDGRYYDYMVENFDLDPDHV